LTQNKKWSQNNVLSKQFGRDKIVN
jgi:hypothetical protein